MNSHKLIIADWLNSLDCRGAKNALLSIVLQILCQEFSVLTNWHILPHNLGINATCM